MDYLRADGIILPPDPEAPSQTQDDDDTWADEGENGDDPSADWPEIHARIRSTITELGGRVHPKLNWSAPKDATWIVATNSMECTSSDDVYLLLKSSDFVTHDLDQAFDGCADEAGGTPPANGHASGAPSLTNDDIPYHLVLRKSIPALITSMEYRCFVRRRHLVGITQRELKHYDFMPEVVPILRALILEFFERELATTFPDDSFVFDVYVPRPKSDGRVWLIDINPWAPRTDPLLFSWLELLQMPEPPEPRVLRMGAVPPVTQVEEGVFRVHINGAGTDPPTNGSLDESDVEDEVDEDAYPEFRVVERDDPENYSFNSPSYSAHKLPLDVVAAGMDGEGGIRDFLSRWDSTTAAAENGVVSDEQSD